MSRTRLRVPGRATAISYVPAGPRRPRLPAAGGGSGCRGDAGRGTVRAMGLRGCRGGEDFTLAMGGL
jgi:hypothetical protein